jgi:3-isopropylmalate/(R)-2-methylmalate dehydratase small subunit
VDLESQLVSYEKEVFKFEMEPHIRERLVKGLDEVGYTLSLYEDKIREYEQRMPRFLRISR